MHVLIVLSMKPGTVKPNTTIREASRIIIPLLKTEDTEKEKPEGASP